MAKHVNREGAKPQIACSNVFELARSLRTKSSGEQDAVAVEDAAASSMSRKTSINNLR